MYKTFLNTQVIFHYICVLKIKIMAKYKVLIPFYKLSEAKNYNESDEIELSKEDAKELIKEGYLDNSKETKEEKEPYSKSKDGTKGIVLKKSIELVDKEIRELNDKL